MFLKSGVLLLTFCLTSIACASEAPLEISSCEGLQTMNQSPRGQFILVKDLDCQGESFTPIGIKNGDYGFQGSFDGNGFEIKNIKIESELRNIGFFSAASAATIKNVILTNISIYTPNPQVPHQLSANVGGLIGLSYGNTILNNKIQGQIHSEQKFADIGGLIGQDTYYSSGVKSRIEGNTTSIDINSIRALNIGGLIGDVVKSTINQNFSSSNINFTTELSPSRVGGLFGTAFEISLSNSYAVVNIAEVNSLGMQIESVIGGLIGSSEDSNITNCYFGQGKIHQQKDYIITGGLIGEEKNSRVTSSYWDQNATKVYQSAGGTPSDTTKMYQKTTYIGWDFDTIWEEPNNSYPTLK